MNASAIDRVVPQLGRYRAPLAVERSAGAFLSPADHIGIKCETNGAARRLLKSGNWRAELDRESACAVRPETERHIAAIANKFQIDRSFDPTDRTGALNVGRGS